MDSKSVSATITLHSLAGMHLPAQTRIFSFKSVLVLCDGSQPLDEQRRDVLAAQKQLRALSAALERLKK
jgi:hypothetical protein